MENSEQNPVQLTIPPSEVSIKTADRPHNYTMLVAVAAIIVSLVSGFVSVCSYLVASENMEVSQRAYVSGTARLDYQNVIHLKEKIEVPFLLVLHNHGNTPAYDVTPNWTSLGLSSWNFANPHEMEGAISLAPKDQRTYRLRLALTPSGWEAIRTRKTAPPEISTEVGYKDIFRERHLISVRAGYECPRLSSESIGLAVMSGCRWVTTTPPRSRLRAAIGRIMGPLD